MPERHPLPWRTSPSLPDRGFEAQIWDANGQAVLFLSESPVGPEADALVERIRRAVNSHDDLLSALLDEVRAMRADGREPSEFTLAVLAKAECER